MVTTKKKASLVFASMLVAGWLTACEKHEAGPAEKAGAQVDKAMDKAGEKLEDAGDKMQDAAHDAAH